MSNVVPLRGRAANQADVPAFPTQGAAAMLVRLQAELSRLETEMAFNTLVYPADIRAGMQLAYDRLQQALAQLAEHFDDTTRLVPAASRKGADRP